MPSDAVVLIIQKHAGELLSLSGVVGLAEGESEGKPCIKVYISRKTSQLISRIPPSLEGYTVCVEETGDFRALSQQ